MSGVRAWWAGLSARERRLLTLMLAIAGAMVLWLGVWRPVEAGLAAGWTRYGAAVDRNASIRAKAALLDRTPHPAAGGGSTAEVVAARASEAGLTLDRNAAQGGGRVAVTIASARAGALFGWLATLEARGIVAETMSVTPGTTPGTVVLQAVLRGPA